MARSKIQVTEQQAEMAKLGATITEIAELFSCDKSTIRKQFSEILKSSQGQMKIAIPTWFTANY